MSRNYRGIYIYTIKLREYPPSSQILMKKIVDDLPFNIIQLEGSYSIKSRSGKTAVKILCTLESDVNVADDGVAILFRYEFIENLGINEINNKYKIIAMEKHVVAAGAANHIEDFYYTKIENSEIYNIKRNDIKGLIQEIIRF